MTPGGDGCLVPHAHGLAGCTDRATVPITRGTPTSIAVNPKTHAVYVGASTPDDASTITVFDGSACGAADHSGRGLPLADVPAGLNPMGLAVDPVTDTVNAALLANGEHASSVAVIDGARCNASNTSGCQEAPALAPPSLAQSASPSTQSRMSSASPTWRTRACRPSTPGGATAPTPADALERRLRSQPTTIPTALRLTRASEPPTSRAASRGQCR